MGKQGKSRRFEQEAGRREENTYIRCKLLKGERLSLVESKRHETIAPRVTCKWI